MLLIAVGMPHFAGVQLVHDLGPVHALRSQQVQQLNSQHPLYGFRTFLLSYRKSSLLIFHNATYRRLGKGHPTIKCARAILA
jgi:hypothetical protein